MINHEIDAWDYQWEFAIAKNMGFCINPCRNLISNIGFTKDALHTTDLTSKDNNALRYEITEINHPDKIILNKELSDRISEENYNIPIHNLGKYYFHHIYRDFFLHPAKKFVKKIIKIFYKKDNLKWKIS